jgi:hypothetical protein
MRLTNIEDILPKDIAGIEIYSGPGTIPLQYRSMSNHTQCGLVLMDAGRLAAALAGVPRASPPWTPSLSSGCPRR